jgi:hypothetical protein
LQRLPESLYRQLYFETRYGDRFGVSDTELEEHVGVIQKAEILTFQNRESIYPYEVKA